MIIWHQIRPAEVQRTFTESFSVEPNCGRTLRLVSVPGICSMSKEPMQASSPFFSPVDSK